MKDEQMALTAKDVAAALSISRSNAYNLMYSKGFPSFRLGRRILVDKNDFIKWYENLRKSSSENIFKTTPLDPNAK